MRHAAEKTPQNWKLAEETNPHRSRRSSRVIVSDEGLELDAVTIHCVATEQQVHERRDADEIQLEAQHNAGQSRTRGDKRFKAQGGGCTL